MRNKFKEKKVNGKCKKEASANFTRRSHKENIMKAEDNLITTTLSYNNDDDIMMT